MSATATTVRIRFDMLDCILRMAPPEI